MLFYRRLPSPLHAARATVAAMWAAALIAAALSTDHPALLGALCLSVLLAGAFAGVGADLVRSLRIAAILAIPIVLGNVLVSRDGLTVFARLGDLGPFGQGDLTVEALVYGAVIALKVAVAMLVSTLASLAADPDELLRAARRLSFRSALTASLAVRMVPLLARDAQRLAEAQRTRPAHGPERGASAPGGGGSYMSFRLERARARVERLSLRARAQGIVLSAIVSGSLDRATDVAATLELRGFATARRAPRSRAPWSRHDLAFAASAIATIALAALARAGGLAPFHAYPLVSMSTGPLALGLCAAFAAILLAPFADRRGIQR
jgi:energy-coupling factor transport system permease protein